MVKVVYIVGAARSGSTLLGSLLGELDGFFFVGELRQLWRRGLIERRACGCGEPLDRCPVWTAILAEGLGPPGSRYVRADDMVRWQREAVRLRHTGSILRTGVEPERAPRPLASYAAAMGALYRATASVTGAKVLVDGSKIASGAAVALRLPQVQPYLLHLVRDPRAVAFSWARHKDLPDRPEQGEMLRYGPLRSALAWLAANAGAERVRRAARDGRFLRLRYEDVASAPRDALRSIARWLDEPAAPLPLVGDHVARLTPNHTISGNPVRFRTGEVDVREDAAWSARLPAGSRAVATLVTLPLLGRYGYPVGAADTVPSGAGGEG